MARGRERGRRSDLVGRDVELETGRALLADGARLLTIVGAPGIGKTRLARALLEDAPHRFVDLAAARDLGDTCAAVAAALDVRALSARSADDLAGAVHEALRTWSGGALVLDNVEQVVDVTASNIERWASASAAPLIVTSREPLRVPAERCLPLAPLSVPASDDHDPERILAADAVRVLLARARARRPSFAPSDSEARDLAAIARAVDGIPLALELCAAQLWLLGVHGVRERVESGIGVLGSAVRAGVDRHGTLAAAIAWSWDLLSEAERDALARLSIARGGLDLEAAIALLERSEADTLAVLHALHDRSVLLVEERDGRARYRAYEPVRAFVSERAELGAARARHATHFAARAIRDGARASSVVRRALLADVENVLAACDHLVDPRSETSDAALGASALAAIAPIYTEGHHGPIDRYLERLDRGGEVIGERDAGARGRVELARGTVRSLRWEIAEADARLEAARTWAERARDRSTCAEAWLRTARLRSIERRHDAAADALARARGAIEVGVDPAIDALHAFEHGSSLLVQRRLDEAHASLARASALYGSLGDAAREARAAANAALALMHAGRGDEAVETADAALAAARREGLRRAECEVLAVRANALLEVGRIADAELAIEESLAIARAIALHSFHAAVRGVLAYVRLFQGRFADALPLIHDTEAAYRASGDRDRAAIAAAIQAIAAGALGRDALARERLAAVRAVDSAAVAEVAEIAEAHVALVLARGDDAIERAASRARALAAPASSHTSDARLLRTLLARAIPELAADLEVGVDARWFRVAGGPEVELLRKRAVRLILDALVAARLESPGVALSTDTLFRVGWPGERASESSAKNRVNVTLTRLKDLGLRPLLQSRDDGVLIPPGVKVAICNER